MAEYVEKNKHLIKDWIIKHHYSNEKEFNELYDEFYNNYGECYTYSFVLYQKLQK
jgi:hypothetical protein